MFNDDRMRFEKSDLEDLQASYKEFEALKENPAFKDFMHTLETRLEDTQLMLEQAGTIREVSLYQGMIVENKFALSFVDAILESIEYDEKIREEQENA